MIGGQYLDITGTAPDEPTLHRLKTGCLFAASVGLALWVAGVPEADQPPWRAFGDELGLLFQIVDDILDGDGYVVRTASTGPPARGRGGRRARLALDAIDADTCVLREIVDGLAVRTALSETASSLVRGAAFLGSTREEAARRAARRARARRVARAGAGARMAGLVPGYDKPGQQVDEDAELTVERGRRLRLARRRQARARARRARRRPGGPRRARRRRVDRRLHRRPAPARRGARDRGRRRLRAAPPAAPRRSARRRARAHERARAHRAAVRAAARRLRRVVHLGAHGAAAGPAARRARLAGGRPREAAVRGRPRRRRRRAASSATRASARASLREVAEAALGWGASVAGVVDSGLPGPKGNREFFLHLTHTDDPKLPDDLDERIDAAVAAG